ncbi:hypothetical protein LTR56_000458 [Elasticomyces elasticus]|nr:hypothetical protein LTR22_014186 [Elasticomyces elasticus]KAK3660700.1 hypothetical protein LTR56_000458 [Elasticomyces elasticus]KAK4922846.1 hypothetical protein LTR49_009853 [Elasticomyces elasticus]KAK5759777.1 hypothetical protein LTS12_010117 [Elasticomyces elasticus]
MPSQLFDTLREQLISSQRAPTPAISTVSSSAHDKKRKRKNAPKAGGNAKRLFVSKEADSESDAADDSDADDSSIEENDTAPVDDDDDEDYAEDDFVLEDSADETADVKVEDENSVDESEDGCDEDEGDIQYDYTESEERYPLEAIYDEGILDLHAECVKKLVEVIAIFNKHDCDTPAVKEFRLMATELQQILPTEPIKVAMLGNTGAGKSSTSNSALDEPDLAKEGSIGKAVTCVGTELRRPFPDQTTKFRSRSEFWNLEEREKLFKGQLENYKLFHFTKDKSRAKDVTQLYQARAKTALELFLGLFKEFPEFLTEHAAKSYLHKNMDTKVIAVTMVDWSRTILKKREQLAEENDRLVEYHDAGTTRELRKSIDALMSAKNKRKEPALWPLVRLVSIDTTLSFIDTCQMAWVVAKSDRICEDIAVRGFLERYGERFEGKIWVIATRADDVLMDANTVSALEAEGRKVPLQYKQLTKETIPLVKEINKKEKRLAKMQESGEKEGLQRDKDAARRTLNDLDHERFGLLVTTRNGFIIDDLQREMCRILPKGVELPVHPISNRHYAAVKGVLPIPPPRLSPEGTGIPALRAHVLRVPAPALMQTFESYVNAHYGVFVQGLDLWANSQFIQNPEDLRQVIESPKRAFAITIDEYLKHIANEAREKITKPLAAKQGQFATHAQKEVSKWHKFEVALVLSQVLCS